MVHAQSNHSINIYELDEENPQKSDFERERSSTGDPSQSSDAGDSSSVSVTNLSLWTQYSPVISGMKSIVVHILSFMQDESSGKMN